MATYEKGDLNVFVPQVLNMSLKLALDFKTPLGN